MYARIVVLRSKMHRTDAHEHMVSKAHRAYRLDSLLVTPTLVPTRALFPVLAKSGWHQKKSKKKFLRELV